jgi:hypothetical protein
VRGPRSEGMDRRDRGGAVEIWKDSELVMAAMTVRHRAAARGRQEPQGTPNDVQERGKLPSRRRSKDEVEHQLGKARE